MDNLKINVNGIVKYASGLTKKTTVQDVKFALLLSSDPHFKPNLINHYGLFEQWQSNERLLDSNIKIYKIIKRWNQMSNDQLSHVKFVIKKKISLTNKKNDLKNKYKFCTLSPSVQKTWNENLIQKNKTSYVKKQLEKLNECMIEYDNISLNSIPSSAWSTDNEDTDYDFEEGLITNKKRYASIRRQNRVRNSSIRRINQDQNEQKNNLDQIEKFKKELNKIKYELFNVKNKNKNDLETNRIKPYLVDEMKTNLIQSLENELKRLCEIKSIKQLSTSDSLTSLTSTDTGISSTNCIDDDYQLETLV